MKKTYVYVTYDPLYEEVICVHKKENSTCKACKKIMRNYELGKRDAYYLEVHKRLLKD